MSRSLQRRRSSSVLSRQEARRRAAIGSAVEMLEERRLFTTLTVNTTADDTTSDSALSLREAIALVQNNGDANAALGRTLTSLEESMVDTSTDGWGTNDTILFTDGVPGGTITLGDGGSGSAFTISTAVTIDGGASGVTLSGGVSQAAWRAFYVNSTGNLTLKDLTVDNFGSYGPDGNVSAGGNGLGGAIYVDGGALTLTSATLAHNSAIGGDGDADAGGHGIGGAIYMDAGTVTITNSTLQYNAAIGGAGEFGNGGQGLGGAIYNNGGNLTITATLLDHNSATGGDGLLAGGGLAGGGAVFAAGGAVTDISGSTLTYNTATAGNGDPGGSAQGGAVYSQGTLTITDGTLDHNGVIGHAAFGGAVFNAGTFTLGITGGSLSYNTAAGSNGGMGSGGYAQGGAIYSSTGGSALISFVNGTLSNNSVTGGDSSLGNGGQALGGFIYLGDGTLTITGGTVGNNAATGGDGDGAGGDASGGALYLESNADATLSNTTVDHNAATGGNNNMGGLGTDGTGGAIYNDQGTLTLTNTSLTYNSASNGNAAGGAVFNNEGAFTLSMSGGTVSNNMAAGGDGDGSAGAAQGGAIYSHGGSASLAFNGTTLDHNTVTGGQAMLGGTGGSASGGVIYFDQGDLDLTSSTLSTNSATGGTGANANGGAVYGTGAAVSVTVTDSTLDQNVANGGMNSGMGGGAGSGFGGAIYNNAGALTVTGSTLSNNSVAGASNFMMGGAGVGYGGAIYNAGGTLDLADSTLDHNSATGGMAIGIGGSGANAWGGAVYAWSSVVTVTNSTLASNSTTGGMGGPMGGGNGSGQGGGIFVRDGNTTVSFSTLSSNTAAQGGTGLYVYANSVATVQIDNSILGQADNSVTDLEFVGTVNATGSNNLIRNTAVIGIGNLSNADPKLGALQNNGGPTQTMRPAADSPALDAADNTVPGSPGVDQRGIARSGAYDIGAYEVVTATLTVTGTDDDDTRDSVLTLREAFRLIDGRLDYADLTVDEQAQITGTLGDVYFIEFDASLAGATFGISEDDSHPISAPPIFTPPTFGPTAFTVSKTVTITGLDDGDGDHMQFVSDAYDLRLFLVTATGELTLKNLDIVDFAVRGADDGFEGESVQGGALFIYGGVVTIEDCAFLGNHALAGDGGSYGGHAAGGAIYNAYGTLTIEDTEFQDNSAEGGEGEDDTGGNARGGAIYGQGGTISLDNVSFMDNEAVGGDSMDGDGGGAYGGAVYVDGGTVTAQYLGLIGSRATGGESMDGDGGEAYGGALYVDDVTFTGTFVVLAENQASGGDGDDEGGDAYGGAMYVEGGTVNFASFAMVENRADGGDGWIDEGGDAHGGALAMNEGDVALTGGEITGNSAEAGDSEVGDGGYASGGAIDAWGGALTLVNATVAQNSADAGIGWDGDDGWGYGGAIHAYNGDLTINFSTISGNEADEVRGVYFEMDGDSHLLAVDNSILGEADDSDYDLSVGVYGGTFTASGSHNLIRVGGAMGIDNVSDADPRLAPLGYYGGGFFQTFALLPDSPALDAAGAVGPVDYDARGADRGYNGTADIGAFESQGYTLTVDDGSTPQSAVIGEDFDNDLMVTLTENFDDAPIPGATVSFTLNTSGSASASFTTTATTDRDGVASVSATANGSVGSYTVTASVGGDGDQAESEDIALTNTAVAPAITSANQGTFTIGSSASFTITTTGTPTATLSKTGTLPAGLTFTDNGDGTATLSGTPTATGTFTLTITAHNDGSPDATQTFTLTVNQAPAITSAGFTGMTAGTAGSFTITTTGFPAAVINKSGALPAGLTFVDNGNGTATLSGTPAAGAAGVYVLSIGAGNGVGSVASQVFTLTVSPAPISGVTGTAPTITSPATLSLVAGQAGTFTVTTTGSPIPTLHVTGTLPAGVTFVDNGDGTGTFSGTATAAGSYGVSVVADNGVGDPLTQSLAITVNGARPIIIASGYAGGTISINNPDGTNRFTISNPFKKKNVGVRLASADLNGDGVPDIIAAAGTSGQPQVIVYDGLTGDQLTSFMAFNKSFTGGVFVAAADVNHDGTPDIVVGQGIGGTSKVRVFSGKDSSLLADFNPFGANAGGARVAAADVNGDGFAEIVVGQGFGGGQSMVKVIDGKALSKQGNAKTLSAFSQAQLGFSGGAFVSTGDVNGDGTPDILVSQSVGTKPYVTVVDGKKAAKNNLKSAVISKFRVASDDGARITSNDVNGDGFDDILASVTLKGKSLVKIFSGADGSLLDTIEGDGSGKGFVA